VSKPNVDNKTKIVEIVIAISRYPKDSGRKIFTAKIYAKAFNKRLIN
jgi:hypothetical protein